MLGQADPGLACAGTPGVWQVIVQVSFWPGKPLAKACQARLGPGMVRQALGWVKCTLGPAGPWPFGVKPTLDQACVCSSMPLSLVERICYSVTLLPASRKNLN